MQISYPGDPIPNPQTRRGNWPDRDFRITDQWDFFVDSKSHAVSEKQTPKFKLTGESAGRQIWSKSTGDKTSTPNPNGLQVVFNPKRNPNSSDLLLRNYLTSIWTGERPDPNNKPKSAKDAAHKGMAFFQMLQTEDGHWAGDYGGPMFLMPGLICTLYLTKTPFPSGRREGMIMYLKNHQQTDGGWGTHIENASTMFGTVLSYIALRLLGEPAESNCICQARAFIHSHGGALYAPSWAKFWMAVIGVYDWKGINSIPAEMWSLPRWFPLHPGKLWCHCRMVYLPMCYLYSRRYSPDVSKDPLLQALRKELYRESDGPYEKINWDAFRQTCAPIDEYSPLNPVMKVAQDFLALYEAWLPSIPFFRNARANALKFVIEYIHAEDLQTNYIDIGPVNKALNMLSVFVADGFDSDAFQRHIARVDDYIWVAEDGVKMQGYNGSQCWDTSFTVRAMVEGGLAEQFPECARKIYSYLDRTQIASNEDNRERYFRHLSKGGWPFSTAAHGWPITDCTSEGLKGVLALHSSKLPPSLIPSKIRISDARLCDACDVLLSYHNEDGGWATYENNRGYRWYEMLNPSEVFGDIMIDYSYVECSSATITALKEFAAAIPHYRSAEVINAIQAGRSFLKSIQRPDGSWYGSWGNCFTYGTWFGIEGLVCAGEPVDSTNVRNAVQFLLSKQNPNGGWGESYLACINKAYPAEGTGPVSASLPLYFLLFVNFCIICVFQDQGEGGSGVVQTAWALLGLLAGGCTDKVALDRGRDFLMCRQLPTGDWAQEGITGVFNRSCGITYTAYRNLFPMWALARYAAKYEAAE